MKNLFKSFLAVAVLLSMASISEARGIQQFGKLAKNGSFTTTTGAAPVIVSANGNQGVTGVLITTTAGGGQLTLLYDTNLIEDELATACFFDAYTPASTTQFYDFTGIGTPLTGSTQGRGPNATSTYISGGTLGGLLSDSQVNPSSGIMLETTNAQGGDAAAGIKGNVTVYVDSSAD